MKTPSEALKSRDSVPADPEANNTTLSQPGPEDGRDQNIKPDSNSYDPAVIASPVRESSRPAKAETKPGENHNAEVYRSGK